MTERTRTVERMQFWRGFFWGALAAIPIAAASAAWFVAWMGWLS